MSDATPIENVSLPMLIGMQTKAAAALAVAKEGAASVAAEINRRYAESAKHALSEAGKSHGSVTLPLQDGIVVKGDVKQTVKWDSAKLMEIAQTMPWDRVAAMFKIEFSMPEAIYKGVGALSPELQKKIDAARTTVIAAPSLKLVQG
jgi:hypothetical protein